MLDLETGKVKDFVKFDVGNLCMVTGGHNNGRVGTIVHKEKHKVRALCLLAGAAGRGRRAVGEPLSSQGGPCPPGRWRAPLAGAALRRGHLRGLAPAAGRKLGHERLQRMRRSVPAEARGRSRFVSEGTGACRACTAVPC